MRWQITLGARLISALSAARIVFRRSRSAVDPERGTSKLARICRSSAGLRCG